MEPRLGIRSTGGRVRRGGGDGLPPAAGIGLFFERHQLAKGLRIFVINQIGSGQIPRGVSQAQILLMTITLRHFEPDLVDGHGNVA